jgi:hypothetical protein
MSPCAIVPGRHFSLHAAALHHETPAMGRSHSHVPQGAGCAATVGWPARAAGTCSWSGTRPRGRCVPLRPCCPFRGAVGNGGRESRAVVRPHATRRRDGCVSLAKPWLVMVVSIDQHWPAAGQFFVSQTFACRCGRHCPVLATKCR